jgi:hypothetical protein
MIDYDEFGDEEYAEMYEEVDQMLEAVDYDFKVSPSAAATWPARLLQLRVLQQFVGWQQRNGRFCCASARPGRAVGAVAQARIRFNPPACCSVQVNDKVIGTVIEIDDDGAYVEIGAKAIAFCPVTECSFARLKTVRWRRELRWGGYPRRLWRVDAAYCIGRGRRSVRSSSKPQLC